MEGLTQGHGVLLGTHAGVSHTGLRYRARSMRKLKGARWDSEYSHTRRVGVIRHTRAHREYPVPKLRNRRPQSWVLAQGYMRYSESSHGVHGVTPSTHQGRLSRLWHRRHQASLQAALRRGKDVHGVLRVLAPASTKSRRRSGRGEPRPVPDCNRPKQGLLRSGTDSMGTHSRVLTDSRLLRVLAAGYSHGAHADVPFLPLMPATPRAPKGPAGPGGPAPPASVRI